MCIVLREGLIEIELAHTFEVLAKIENRLMESNINATVIKPSFFMDNFLRIAKVEDERITQLPQNLLIRI